MPEFIELSEDDREEGITNAWKCSVCSRPIYRYRGTDDQVCSCGAIYNAFGQRLRDDLYSRPNPSEWDENISDLDGYEMMYAGDE